MFYTNPILQGDYSDPDVILANGSFYMVASSFTYLPGLPILRSKDLCHWQLIGYAAKRLPFPRYDAPAHKCGAWAPSIRFHKGRFYVYVCLPDEGLLVFSTLYPGRDWDCHYVKDVCGWIDPCPLFDRDGSVWLVHGMAASRCGINNVLYAHRMSDDGLEVLDKGVLIYNGADHGDITTEGPKWYQRNGWYYILCPAGGVKPGYQLALRSKNRLGPYERRVVLSQGSTNVNGPHQGALFDDPAGRSWFIHFQDRDGYGRVTHLQPVRWREDWPVIGNEGEPVAQGNTLLPFSPCHTPDTDRFEHGPGLQWQWQANPDPAWSLALEPGLRLFAAPAPSLFRAGQFLSQLMQRFSFCMEAAFTPHLKPGGMAGIAMMGYPYHYLAFSEGELLFVRGDITEHGFRTPETVLETVLARFPAAHGRCVLRLCVWSGRMRFYAFLDDGSFLPAGEELPLSPGGWTGARPGIFCLGKTDGPSGYADFEYVRFSDYDPKETSP